MTLDDMVADLLQRLDRDEVVAMDNVTGDGAWDAEMTIGAPARFHIGVTCVSFDENGPFQSGAILYNIEAENDPRPILDELSKLVNEANSARSRAITCAALADWQNVF